MHTGLEGIVPAFLWIAEILVFLLSIFKEPSTGLYLLIPLLPLETVRYRLHGYFLGAQFVDVLLLGVVLGLKRRGMVIIPKTPLTALLIVYVVFTYLSMLKGSFYLGCPLPLWFSDPRVSDWKNFVVDLSLIFFVACSAIRTKRQMKILVATMGIGLLLIAKNFHSEIGDRDFSAFSYDLRGSGTMGGAGVNGLAAFTAQVSIFFLALFLFERRVWVKIGYFLPICGGIYCVLFALSRGAYGAVIIGALFLGIIRSRMLLFTLLLFLLVWQSVVPPAVSQRILTTTDGHGEVEHSAAARLSLWEDAVQVFESDPVFGTGFNTYAYGSHVGGYADTHNLFAKVLVETGLIGMVVFLAILRKLFQIGFQLYRSATDPFFRSVGLGLAALMISAVVANFFGDRWMYFQITGYTYAFAALAFRAQQLTDEEHGQDEEQEEPVEGQTTDVVLENGERSVSGTEPIQSSPYYWEPREGYAPGSNLS